jgi:PAS domain S-box-containing protein
MTGSLSDSKHNKSLTSTPSESIEPHGPTGFPDLFKAVFEALQQIHDMVYFLDLHGNVSGFNPYCSELTGCSSRELASGRDVFARLVHPEDRDQALAVPKAGVPMTEVDYRLFRKDGAILSMHSYRLAAKDETGNLCGFICLDRDFTERVSTAEALKAERDRAHEYLNIAGVILVALDIDQRVTMINRKGCETIGLTEKEILGTRWFDRFVPPPERDSARNAYAQLMAGELEEVEHFENPVLCCDGRVRLVAWHNTVLRGKDGTILGTLSSGEDITETMKAQAALRDREEELTSIFRAAPVGIGLAVSRVVKQANQRLCEMLGYSPVELIGLDSRGLYPDDADYQYVGDEKYRQIRETGTGTVETRWKRKDGQIIDVLLSSTPIDQDDWSKGITFTALDITERKISERALIEKNIAMREILRQISSDQDAIREQIATNIGEAIVPLLERLEERVGPTQQALVSQLRKEFDQVSSPFLELLKNRQPQLTPRETEICRLIKSGLTSKEIAEILSLSLGTVHKYRELIRRKLGLANIDVNLTSYLQSL